MQMALLYRKAGKSNEFVNFDYFCVNILMIILLKSSASPFSTSNPYAIFLHMIWNNVRCANNKCYSDFHCLSVLRVISP